MHLKKFMSFENVETTNGENAYKKIMSKLSQNPAAQKLTNKIYEFYGTFLNYAESQEALSSKFSFDLQHEPSISFKSAYILLQLNTGRESEALTHELLHLDIPIRGYPLIEGTNSDDFTDEILSKYSDLYPEVENLIHHELNIESFKKIGYAKKHFLGSVTPPRGDYKAMVLNPLPERSYDNAYGFSWWCLEYFRHWISIRHGKALEAKSYVEDALHWGFQMHPELQNAAKEMRNWVKIGEYKNPDRYPYQINALMEIMNVPKVTFFAYLENAEPQKPAAKRLII